MPHFAVLFSHILAYVQWQPFTYASTFSTLVDWSVLFSAHFYIGFASGMVFVIFKVTVGIVHTHTPETCL